MKKSQSGFTLMEMIGVVAVIAILASMATPMIFDAIRNARISAFVEDINVARTAVASYYADTGTFPNHNPDDTGNGRVLMRDHATTPIGGWSGPYLEKELSHPFGDDLIRIYDTTTAAYQFDLDGDGNMDTQRVSVLRLDDVSDLNAKKLSEILDSDTHITTGDAAWNKAGRVKRYGTNGDHASILLIYLSRS